MDRYGTNGNAVISETKHKGISRIDSGSTHGWFVRGYRNGKTFSKLFSDRKSGSKGDALEAAVTYRDSLYAELEQMPQKPRARRMVYRDSRNTTGVLGVSRTSKTDAKGRTTECYSVSWRPEPGKQKCTSFSIRKYGEEKAFELAVALRKEKLKEIYGPDALKAIDDRARKNGDTSIL
ncbi:MAG: AP2 domain-containing protein [Verrucomicrobiota bacterium]